MNIKIEKMHEKEKLDIAKMITELMNYHRKLTKARKEFYQTDEESLETVNEWNEEGEIYKILHQEELAGFFYIKFGGHNAAWLEDLYIKEAFRGKGLGKAAMNELDKMLQDKGILAMFVDVIPRNTRAIEFYQEIGFDHLNMIQLRKNYDKTLDKSEEVDLLGYKFKKY
ncbi:GNAT family N-acetyltransferase [Oceanirhabdus seepicola]|uniref:GNAT family N-acetyltransferase n=1 Tax=Oceanirhabdus seepicola TaxID=2828781 RepID=A0A9J6NWA5_9CLOT|nr:GNAT family N-acetyltransferase [Oceanirhabdus seepicola]MCM1988523.1 GNAT family N-acetyltransferase [Oceanirhabdus seepicola]